MTQDDNEKRQEIRRKTAEAIQLIDQAMAARHKLPNDRHDVHDLEGIARRAGESMVRHMNDAGFTPLAILMDEWRKARDQNDKVKLETTVALDAMAKMFGVEHQFITATSAEDRAAASPVNGSQPPQSGPSVHR